MCAFFLYRPTAPRRSYASACRGFTLIELLVVIAIMAMIIAMSGFSMGHIVQAMGLTNSGNRVVQIMDAARQHAMANNSLTAVVMITKAAPNDTSKPEGRAFTIVERKVGQSWKAIREWEILSEGVTVDINASVENSTFISASPASLPGNGTLPSYRGSTGYSAAMRVFLPGGGVMNPDQPARFQLVPGHIDGSSIKYLRAKDDGTPSNYYRISLLGATGKTKVDRP